MIPLNGDYLRASIKDISPEQKRGKQRYLWAFMATCGLALAVSVGRYFAS